MAKNRALVGATVGMLAGVLMLAPSVLADGHGDGGAVTGTVTSFTLPGSSASSTGSDGSIAISEANGSTETISIAPTTTIDMSAGVLARLLSGAASTQQVTVAVSGSAAGTPVAREIRVAEGGDQGSGTGPRGESYRGDISAVTTTSITIGQYTLTFAPNVRVSYGDRRLTAAEIPTGVAAKVSLDKSGDVTRVQLLADPAVPKDEAVSGTITAASSTSVTIGQYTLALSPNAVIKYHDFSLSAAQIPTGVEAKAKVGKDLTVGKIILVTDPNLPPSKELHGAVTAVGTGTISLDGYTLSVDPSAAIAYQGTAYTLASIQSGWDVAVRLNDGGAVTDITIAQGPQQSSSQASTGSSQGGD